MKKKQLDLSKFEGHLIKVSEVANIKGGHNGNGGYTTGYYEYVTGGYVTRELTNGSYAEVPVDIEGGGDTTY